MRSESATGDTKQWAEWLKQMFNWFNSHGAPSWLFLILGILLLIGRERLSGLFQKVIPAASRQKQASSVTPQVTHPVVAAVQRMRGAPRINEPLIQEVGKAYVAAIQSSAAKGNSQPHIEAWQLSCFQKTEAKNFTSMAEWDALIKWLEARSYPHPFTNGKYFSIDALDLFRHANKTQFDFGDTKALLDLLTKFALESDLNGQEEPK